MDPDIYGGPDEGVVDIYAEDMDGDDVIDIAIGNRCGASVILLQGQGDRRFKQIENVRTYSVEGIVIKDLKVKGTSSVVKVGTKVKNIRLVEGDHDIDCRVVGIGPMKLKSCFVKKA